MFYTQFGNIVEFSYLLIQLICKFSGNNVLLVPWVELGESLMNTHSLSKHKAALLHTYLSDVSQEYSSENILRTREYSRYTLGA